MRELTQTLISRGRAGGQCGLLWTTFDAHRLEVEILVETLGTRFAVFRAVREHGDKSSGKTLT